MQAIALQIHAAAKARGGRWGRAARDTHAARASLTFWAALAASAAMIERRERINTSAPTRRQIRRATASAFSTDLSLRTSVVARAAMESIALGINASAFAFLRCIGRTSGDTLARCTKLPALAGRPTSAAMGGAGAKIHAASIAVDATAITTTLAILAALALIAGARTSAAILRVVEDAYTGIAAQEGFIERTDGRRRGLASCHQREKKEKQSRQPIHRGKMWHLRALSVPEGR